jgi:hypothetical protein
MSTLVLILGWYFNCERKTFLAVLSRFRDCMAAMEVRLRLVLSEMIKLSCTDGSAMIHPFTQKYNALKRLVVNKPSGWVHEDLVRAAGEAYLFRRQVSTFDARIALIYFLTRCQVQSLLDKDPQVPDDASVQGGQQDRPGYKRNSLDPWVAKLPRRRPRMISPLPLKRQLP